METQPTRPTPPLSEPRSNLFYLALILSLGLVALFRYHQPANVALWQHGVQVAALLVYVEQMYRLSYELTTGSATRQFWARSLWLTNALVLGIWVYLHHGPTSSL